MAKDEIRVFVVGHLETNCFAYVSEGECLVVDPGAMGEAIAEQLKDVRVTQVVATHRHHDHVGGIAALVRATGAPWAIHRDDAAEVCHALDLSSHDLVSLRGSIENPPEPDQILVEGDEISVGTAQFEVLHTPGHTPGGIVLVGKGSAEGIAFVGDTLFAGSCGRCDLYGGSWPVMQKTLERLRTTIDPNTQLLTGHGPATTMAQELAYNPYLQEGAWRPSAG